MSRGPPGVLVTGGAGFIGSHTVDGLLAEGYRVRVLDNLLTGCRANLPSEHPGLEFVEGDVRDAATLEAAMDGITHCLHLAAQVSVERSVADPRGSSENNVLGAVNVFQAARDAELSKVVYASSAAVYGDLDQLPLTEDAALRPSSPYGLEKRINEQYAALFRSLFGLSMMGLRYFNVYGPRQDPASPYAGVISTSRTVCCPIDSRGSSAMASRRAISSTWRAWSGPTWRRCSRNARDCAMSPRSTRPV